MGIVNVKRQKTNLWFLVNFRVHLRADEREQAHSVSFPQQVLLAIGHVDNLVPQYLSGDKGGSSESQGLIQCAIWEETEENVIFFESQFNSNLDKWFSRFFCLLRLPGNTSNLLSAQLLSLLTQSQIKTLTKHGSNSRAVQRRQLWSSHLRLHRRQSLWMCQQVSQHPERSRTDITL